ncbi:5-formyltetrahydrofolate cyclo-ligase [Paraliobacillus sp. JSM ZJ581]|uniref:5-formyltetrahydrofolate cyclo-ligase n=1 Tax=Paraliobacillus sp. JSM ZJ581 TaxID=3342118 RepID=UPI0035A8BAD5
MDNQKTLLRNEIKQKLIKLTDEQRKNIQTALQDELWKSPAWNQATVIGTTISQRYEWNTKPIIREAWNQGKTVVVPKCNPKQKSLTFYQLEDFEQLETVYYQLQEPKPDKTKEVTSDTIDLLIVPGLVFDLEHYRIGHGGGYYDRFLSNFNGTTLSIAWSGQVVHSIPIEPFDIPVTDLIVCS